MYYKNALRLLLEMVHPIQKSLLIRMSAHACQLLDMRVDGNCLAKQAHLFFTLNDISAKCADCLISNEKNRTLGPPEVML